MIELKDNRLIFSFPEVHKDAHFSLELERTLRIPDDGRDYPLPPGLGAFPLRHVDDFGDRVPALWKRHGGVMLPMYQSEALWLNLSSRTFFGSDGYPFAVKVATGKIDAVTGEEWTDGIHRDPQDYMVIPNQPWLDGYCVEKGTIRQFVAMPLGGGYTAEEQITGEAQHGGLQVVAYPMKAEAYRSYLEEQRAPRFSEEAVLYDLEAMPPPMAGAAPDMGLAPGGRMTQEIYEDPFDFDVWDTRHSSRCFIHIANSLAWRAITGEPPPTPPLTSREYNEAGLPWFDYYGGDAGALEGAGTLAELKSVTQMGAEKGENPLPENEGVDPHHVVHLGRASLKPGQVREGEF
ncbi:MAG: hypothetical protein PVJ04_04110 [Gemmatimonadota bacterium]|jgi:hypothetical protein